MASKQVVQWLWLASLLLGVASSGCSDKPTYPKAHLVDSLRTLLAEEHLSHPSIRFVEHTLGVQFDYPNALLPGGGGVGPAFDDAIHKSLPAIHRVIFSTDADVRFYALLVSDAKAPGVYFTMIRYVDDIRREMANMLDTPESLSRTIFDLAYAGPKATMTLEQDIPTDIRLEEFLSWQLARRIQHQLSEEFQTAGSVQVGRCDGVYRQGEFAFTLNVIPASAGPVDEATMRKAFQSSTSLIAKVLSSYQFKSFDSIRLIHPLSGRNLVLPKAHLDIFR